MKHLSAPALALLPLVTLAACTGDDTSKTAPLYCPTVAVLAQANTLTQYEPGHSDIGAQLTTATITGVAGACTLNTDKQLLTIHFKAGFSASNGPADHGRPVMLPYFVAITQGDTITAKSNYTIKVSFDGNVSAASATSKNLTVTFPNAPESAGYEVLVGFQLPPGQAGN